MQTIAHGNFVVQGVVMQSQINQNEQIYPGFARLLLLAALSGMVVGCSFRGVKYPDTPKGIHQSINDMPFRLATEGNRGTVFDVPGKMQVQQGYSCTKAPGVSQENAFELGLRIHDSAVLPTGYAGTVYQNGWRTDYIYGDHHLDGLASAIANIHVEQRAGQKELHWEAGGAMQDWNGDEDYKWCYWYTLVMWNQRTLDIRAHDEDLAPYPTTFAHAETSDQDNSTAVRDLPGLYTLEPTPRAVVPRGFALVYYDLDIFSRDLHLLHAGFDLGYPSVFGHAIAWPSQTLLKDNARRRDYKGASMVSILGGEAVHSWRPETVQVRDTRIPNSQWITQSSDFKLVSRNPTKSCESLLIRFRKYNYKITDVPFAYAVPVLSGWDVGNACSDTHVRNIGVWLTGISYERDPATGKGTLNFTVASNFSDFGDAINLSKFGITILGFNDVPPPPPCPIQHGCGGVDDPPPIFD